MRSNSGKVLPVVLIVFAVLIVLGTVGAIIYADKLQEKQLNEKTDKTPFGFFTDVSAGETAKYDKLKEYDMVVIDPEKFDKGDITVLKLSDVKVMAYLDLASAEMSGEVYKRYEEKAIAERKDKAGFAWMDVTSHEWAEYILAKVAEITTKEVDGFFIDGCDIVEYSTTGEHADDMDTGAVRESILSVLKEIRRRYKKIYIMNAEVFVSYLIRNNATVTDVFDGVCREGVFSVLNSETGEYEANPKFADNNSKLEKCTEAGLAVFVIEHAKDQKLKQEIITHCDTNHYKYYID